MKKLTAMQQLIAFLKQTPMMHAGILQMIEDAKLLEVERNNIIKAVSYGNGRANVEDKMSLGEQYFKNNFNQE